MVGEVYEKFHIVSLALVVLTRINKNVKLSNMNETDKTKYDLNVELVRTDIVSI